MAAITAPERTAAQHQSLLHFVGESPWLDDLVLSKVREMVQPAIERGGAIEAWIIDDTGFPKKGKHSCLPSWPQYCRANPTNVIFFQVFFGKPMASSLTEIRRRLALRRLRLGDCRPLDFFCVWDGAQPLFCRLMPG